MEPIKSEIIAALESKEIVLPNGAVNMSLFDPYEYDGVRVPTLTVYEAGRNSCFLQYRPGYQNIRVIVEIGDLHSHVDVVLDLIASSDIIWQVVISEIFLSIDKTLKSFNL